MGEGWLNKKRRMLLLGTSSKRLMEFFHDNWYRFIKILKKGLTYPDQYDKRSFHHSKELVMARLFSFNWWWQRKQEGSGLAYVK